MISQHFGLDLGSFSIKVIKANKEGTKYRLESFGEVLTPGNIISGLEKDKVALVEAIKKLIKDAKIKTNQAALALPEIHAYSQVVKMPYLSEAELASAIKFEAEQYIPVPLPEVQLEYQTLQTPYAKGKDEKIEVLLVAAKKTAIEKILEICKLADIEPISLETETLATIRALTVISKDFHLIINFGKNTTSISLVKNGSLRFVRTLNFGSEAVTRAMANELNMEFSEAERYKMAYGLLPDQLEGKVATIISSIFTNALSEIKQCLTFFNKEFSGSILNSVLLSGGMAAMPGITAFLAKQLDVEVTAANPFVSFIKDETFPKALMSNYSKFSTAVGLAIRGL